MKRPRQERNQEQVHHVRITLSSKNARNLEKVCADLVSGAKNNRLQIKGDDGTPVKILPMSSINSPCLDGKEHSVLQDVRSSKKGCTNFRWSPAMSRFLLPFLVEQAKLGRKVNKTFKRQALVAAARAVSEKFNLNCTDSNVENHMRTVKTRYAQIKKLQDLSNAVWDEKEKKITMDTASYNEYIMANPKDEPFLNKKIEMYDEMAIICGDDQALRNLVNAATADNAENNEGVLVGTDDDINIVMDEDIEIEQDDEEDEDEEEETQSKSQQVSMSSESTGRTGQSDKCNHHLGNKIDHLASQIGELAEAIRSIHKGISLELFTEVMKCEGYDETSLGKAFDYLHAHENMGRAFLVKNNNLRQAWLADFFSGGGLMG